MATIVSAVWQICYGFIECNHIGRIVRDGSNSALSSSITTGMTDINIYIHDMVHHTYIPYCIHHFQRDVYVINQEGWRVLDGPRIELDISLTR